MTEPTPSSAPSGAPHFIASLMTPGHFRTAWRLPESDPTLHLSIDHYQRLARIADEVGLDAIFLGDAPALGPDIASTPGGGIDPLVLLGNLLAITERVGAVATSSSTYNSPYNLARRFQSLDIVTKGRAAVNVVTTFAPAAAANFGLSEAPEKEVRYRRAHEFLDVVTKLWDAWEPGALPRDKETGVYGDVDRIHPIDHRGEFFAVRGPLPVPAGPQGRPVVVQAGGSAGGLRLAGDFADVVFTVAQTQGKAVAFRDDVRARAVAAGRGTDAVKISLGVIVLVGETDADAQERLAALQGTLPLADVAQNLLATLGIPDHGVDQPIHVDDLPALAQAGEGSTGFQVSLRALVAEQTRTASELVRLTVGASAGGHRLVVGSPEAIADDLEDWWRAGTADGFTVMYADSSVDFERFARLVVPILAERGLFAEAQAGQTLRDRLGLPAAGPSAARSADADRSAASA
ncbi:MAG TPA: NtaA/DmoA family FMN-dependent monooxygenase [Nocardioides sp.]